MQLGHEDWCPGRWDQIHSDTWYAYTCLHWAAINALPSPKEIHSLYHYHLVRSGVERICLSAYASSVSHSPALHCWRPDWGWSHPLGVTHDFEAKISPKTNSLTQRGPPQKCSNPVALSSLAINGCLWLGISKNALTTGSDIVTPAEQAVSTANVALNGACALYVNRNSGVSRH